MKNIPKRKESMILMVHPFYPFGNPLSDTISNFANFTSSSIKYKSTIIEILTNISDIPIIVLDSRENINLMKNKFEGRFSSKTHFIESESEDNPIPIDISWDGLNLFIQKITPKVKSVFVAGGFIWSTDQFQLNSGCLGHTISEINKDLKDLTFEILDKDAVYFAIA